MTETRRPAPPTLEQLAQYAIRFNESPILALFGVHILFPSLDRVRVVLDPIQPAHRGGLGTAAVNGGVLAAVFDLTIGITPALIDPTRRNATMQLSMNFERPVRGNRLTAEGFIHRAGGTTLSAGAEIYDEAGQVCARAQGLVRMSQGKWERDT